MLSIQIDVFSDAMCDEKIQAIKKVYLKKENDNIFLHIDLNEDINFVPRIHTMANGVKLILCFDKEIAQPKIHKLSDKIIKGCFFEKFGYKSLMFVAALNDYVIFFEKKYTKDAIKIGFKQLYKPTIVIDAGHGGTDTGSCGVSGDYEKNIAFIFAIELRNFLIRTNKYKVVLTRDTDELISFGERIKKIESCNADLVISIHTDSNKNENLRGISTYTLPNWNQMNNVSVINQDDENQAKLLTNFKKNLQLSRRFARYVINYFPNYCQIKKSPCRSIELKILKTAVPSVLIELGYISNKIDDELLHSKDFREKACCAIFYALNDFFRKVKK